MAQYGFHFDSSRCTGCRTCVMACKDYKDLSQTETFRKLYDFEGGTWTKQEGGAYTTNTFAYHVSVACNHCVVPACVGACAQSAIAKDADTGIVYIDAEACTGDASCVVACPYGAPFINQENGLAAKCDMCQDRVTEGKMPMCVDACPLRALEFGDFEELKAKHGEVSAIAPLPSADQTHPALVINPSSASKEPGDTSGVIVNELETLGAKAFTPAK